MIEINASFCNLLAKPSPKNLISWGHRKDNNTSQNWFARPKSKSSCFKSNQNVMLTEKGSCIVSKILRLETDAVGAMCRLSETWTLHNYKDYVHSIFSSTMQATFLIAQANGSTSYSLFPRKNLLLIAKHFQRKSWSSRSYLNGCEIFLKMRGPLQWYRKVLLMHWH